MENNFTVITEEQAIYIVENMKTEEKSKNHLYWYQSNNNNFVAIDNSSQNAWVEIFPTKEICFNWLNGDFEMSDYLEKEK